MLTPSMGPKGRALCQQLQVVLLNHSIQFSVEKYGPIIPGLVNAPRHSVQPLHSDKKRLLPGLSALPAKSFSIVNHPINPDGRVIYMPTAQRCPSPPLYAAFKSV